MMDLESAILLAAIIILYWFIINSSESESYDDSEKCVDSFREEDNEEMFYHPVTGYKGDRKNMDAYIYNREKKLKDNE